MHPCRDGGPIAKAFPQGGGGAMVSERKHVSHKLPGTISRVPGYQVFHQVQGKRPSALANRQCHGSSLHKQNGRHPLSSSLPAGQGPLGLVPEPQCVNKGSVSPGSTKRPCGSRIQSVPRFQRLEAEHNDFRPNVSKVTFQLDQYVSWRPDPLAIHTDAFTLNWATFQGYAFPPFALIGRCLQQVQSQGVEHLVLVAPVWPAQTWYPLLLELCVDFPLLLPMQANLLTQQGRNHPLHQLQLAGWLLSTVVTRRKEFLSKLERFSWQLGDQTPQAPIPPHGIYGVAGVLKESLSIPFHHL